MKCESLSFLRLLKSQRARRENSRVPRPNLCKCITHAHIWQNTSCKVGWDRTVSHPNVCNFLLKFLYSRVLFFNQMQFLVIQTPLLHVFSFLLSKCSLQIKIGSFSRPSPYENTVVFCKVKSFWLSNCPVEYETNYVK